MRPKKYQTKRNFSFDGQLPYKYCLSVRQKHLLSMLMEASPNPVTSRDLELNLDLTAEYVRRLISNLRPILEENNLLIYIPKPHYGYALVRIAPFNKLIKNEEGSNVISISSR